MAAARRGMIVVDVVTGWEGEIQIPPDAALRMKRRLDRLLSTSWDDGTSIVGVPA